MADVVLSAVDGRGVATVTLNRPEVHNAYDGALVGALIETLERLDLLPRTFGLAQGLSVPSLTVRVGPDVWLQSDDARIKLADFGIGKLRKLPAAGHTGTRSRVIAIIVIVAGTPGQHRNGASTHQQHCHK